jgi:hypothetical protein
VYRPNAAAGQRLRGVNREWADGEAKGSGERCPELDCVRARLTPQLIAAAARRAAALGVGAERVLIATRQISEDSYVVALAASLRLRFEPLDGIERADCPLTDEQFRHADATGLMPLQVDGGPVWVMAPLTHSARRIIDLVATRPEFAPHIRLTTTQRLRNFITQGSAVALGLRAAENLRATDPLLSAGSRGPPHGLAGVMLTGSLLVAALFVPRAVVAGLSATLTFVFVAWTLLRLVGATTRWRHFERLRIPPDALPAYTIIVALYDEAAAAADLIRALDRLAYPPEKLQIIIALEPEDHATQAAFARLNFTGPYEIAIAPNIGPRTKPKALNAALAFARGKFVAVYDAEDRPAPDQLQRALDVFLSGDDAIACVQARLSIDNTRDGWLARGIMAQTPPDFIWGLRLSTPTRRHDRTPPQNQSVRHRRIEGSPRHAVWRDRVLQAGHPRPRRDAVASRRHLARSGPYLQGRYGRTQEAAAREAIRRRGA